jgi:hypothetical protein
MNLKVHNSCEKLGKVFSSVIGDNDMTKGVQFAFGPASDSEFGTEEHAADNPLFVGDSAHIWGKEIDPMTESLLKTHPERVNIKFVPARDGNGNSGYNVKFSTIPAGMTGDAVSGLIAGQFFSPWNISYFTEVLRQPLTYSNFSGIVNKESGTNPWAEIFSMYTREYAGWAGVGGRLSDQSTNDVNVRDGIMSAPILNLTATYTNTLEEKKRAEVRGNPFGREAMNEKPAYMKYALDMLSDYIGYYGNPENNIDGLLTVNPVEIWGSNSIKVIYNQNPDVASQRGSQIYRILSNILIQFLTRADFKFDRVDIVVSPETYGYLVAVPYSDTYDATSAMATFTKNFNQEFMPSGKKVNVGFIQEPMLKAGTEFNTDEMDYTILLASTVGTGPDNRKQKIVKYAEPLSEFVYPVIPGVYNVQHKMLKRIAGLFAPVPYAIKAYKGLGVNNYG